MKAKLYKALAECVTMAAYWKGSLMPEDYAEFEERIKLAKVALRSLRSQKDPRRQRLRRAIKGRAGVR